MILKINDKVDIVDKVDKVDKDDSGLTRHQAITEPGTQNDERSESNEKRGTRNEETTLSGK
ncbi:MAG: hypothetical protein R2744_01905 [Bacteroidales bacterium]